MAKKFIPAGFDTTLYRKAVQNKDSYGNDKIIVKNDSPTRFDIIDENNVYLGWAEYGIDESEPLWKIKNIKNNGGIWSSKFGDGNELYDNVWNNRTILNYK
jgi:hypothetical protein